MSSHHPPELSELLPQELQELIIDNLSHIEMATEDDRREALRNCISVSRTFWYRARRHIFHSIAITNKRTGVAVRKLALLRQLVDPGERSSPHWQSVVSCIEHFSVINDTKGTENSKSFLDNGDLTSIMKQLHNANRGISTLCLDLGELHSTLWKDLSSDFRDSFRNLCRSPHLKSLEISHFLDIPRSIFNGAYLEHLALCGMSYSTDRESVINGYVEIPQIEATALIIESPPQLLSFVTDHTFLFPRAWTLNKNVHNLRTPLSPFRRLKYLTAPLNANEFLQLWRINSHILLAASRSIEQLNLQFTGNFKRALTEIDSDSFGFANFHQLRSMHFTFASGIIVTSESIKEIGLHPILTVLRFVPPPPNLNTIQIDFILTSRNPKHHIFSPSQQEWTSFQQVLSDFCFASLDVIIVSIQINVIFSGQPRLIDTKRWTAVIRKRLAPFSHNLKDDSRFQLRVDLRLPVSPLAHAIKRSEGSDSASHTE